MSITEQFRYSDTYKPPERQDSFHIHSFTEDVDPASALMAQHVHAESFVLARFVHPDGLEEINDDGRLYYRLPADLDKSRGNDITYVLACSKTERRDLLTDEVVLNSATWRMHDIPEGGSREDLPAYILSKDSLYDWGEQYLRSVDENQPQYMLREIAALGRSRGSDPEGIFEIIRDGIHQSLENDRHEIWFFSIVDTTYSFLKREFGEQAVLQVGNPVAMDDERVNPDVRLVPVVTDTRKFIRQIYESAISTNGSDTHKDKDRQLKRFRFFTDGLSDDQLDTDMAIMRRAIVENLG